MIILKDKCQEGKPVCVSKASSVQGSNKRVKISKDHH